MKTSLAYGAAMAIAGAILNLIFYFAGLHDSAEKLRIAQWLGIVGALAIGITCLALAIREKRAQYPADREWGYGPALGGGVLAGLFGSLFGLITAYAYFAVINPGFCDVIHQMQVATMEARGMSASQIERAEPVLRKMLSPVVMTLMQGASGFVWSLVLSLIVAAFLRKPLPTTPSTEAQAEGG